MTKQNKTVYLIDSSIYVFRAWHLLPDSITNSQNQPVNALYGFADFLVQLLQKSNANYVVCAFDKSLGTSARNKIYPPYKSNRPPAPENLKLQFQLCQELARNFGLASYDSDLYEADDIIGTLADTARSCGFSVCIVSADKDLTQFIRTGDEYWNYAKGIKLDSEGIKKRFGIAAEQVADMLALCGDKVDNIPGIPGVGESTAAKLLAKWGDLDTLFQHTEDVASMKFRGAARVAALLDEYQDTVRLARKLTGLFQVPELPTDITTLQRRTINVEQLESFLQLQGFSDRRRARLIEACQT